MQDYRSSGRRQWGDGAADASGSLSAIACHEGRLERDNSAALNFLER